MQYIFEGMCKRLLRLMKSIGRVQNVRMKGELTIGRGRDGITVEIMKSSFLYEFRI